MLQLISIPSLLEELSLELWLWSRFALVFNSYWRARLNNQRFLFRNPGLVKEGLHVQDGSASLQIKTTINGILIGVPIPLHESIQEWLNKQA
jgi:hypothetical protein